MEHMSAMRLLHPGEPWVLPLGPSIFLAGPTPRSVDVASWRPAAIAALETVGFSGTVLVPERSDWAVKFDYIDQIEWELDGMRHASVIAFWVPRDMATMPALTTNVEFGLNVRSMKALYGRPEGAPHTRYLDYLYTKYTGATPISSLVRLMEAAAEDATSGRK